MTLPEQFGLHRQPVPSTWPVTDTRVDADALDSVDPARPERKLASYAVADAAQMSAVLDRAQAAQAGWAGMSCASRVAVISRWLDAIEANEAVLAQCMTAEQGKPLAESRGEIGKSLRESRQMLGFAGTHAGATMPGRTAGFRNLILRRPHGVVLAISPWNFPVLTPMRKLVPALVSGNAVVLKPSEFTPAAAVVLVNLSQDILPEGVLSLVLGAGRQAAALVADERIRAVSFTGSVSTGRQVAVSASQGLKPVSLEMGGKNGAIVDDVEDLDGALDAIVGAAFQCSGQRCTSISRIIVNRTVLDPVVEGLRQRLGQLKAGPGDDAATTLGPITTQAQLERIEQLVKQAQQQGAICLHGGGRLSPESAPEGRFHEPTLLLCERSDNVAVTEEIFGPVLTLQVWDSDDEAIDLLNDSRYGLTCALFTDRHRLVSRVLSEARTGMIHVNHGTVPDDNMPFVGVGDSGLGIGSVGPSTLDFYTTEHSAYLAEV